MAGQQGQPKYGFGWPDGRLGGLGPPGSTTPALYTSCHPIYENKIFPEPCFTKSSLINIASMYSIICQHNHEILGTNINHYISARLPNK